MRHFLVGVSVNLEEQTLNYNFRRYRFGLIRVFTRKPFSSLYVNCPKFWAKFVKKEVKSVRELQSPICFAINLDRY